MVVVVDLKIQVVVVLVFVLTCFDSSHNAKYILRLKITLTVNGKCCLTVNGKCCLRRGIKCLAMEFNCR